MVRINCEAPRLGRSQGRLNLYKWGAEQTGKKTGWTAGDYMLYLPNQGTPKLNWKANFGRLRSEMSYKTDQVER